MSPPMSQCKSCDASIVWAVHTATGSLAPIDVEPTDGGNIILTTDELGVTRYRVLTKLEAETYKGGDAHLNHFVTCPDATSHRRAQT